MVEVLNDENVQALLASKRIVVVDCWAEWCGPCRRLAPIIDELAAKYEGVVTFGKYDVDEGGGELLAEHGVRNIPTLLFFKDGKFVDRSVGLVNTNVLSERIDALL